MPSNSNSSSYEKPAFSVRIVVCDHYLTKPVPGVDVIYSEFRGADIKQVPVFRIFGSAPDGHKTCLHIHGVFPYFYIPCPTSNPEPQFLYQIASGIDRALNIALKQATSSNQHVYKISLVKALPFYGFHYKEHLYLKVFLYNPGLVKQAVDLCSNGAVLGQSFQPHESHINFTLQFFIDFNLFGMSNIDLQTLRFRKKDGISQSSDDPTSPSDCFLKPESICYYEADCMASHIINRQRVGRGDGIENPGLEEVWNQEMERRKQLNISMASKSLSQRRLNTEETDSHYKFEQMFLIKMTNLINKPVDIVLDKEQLSNEIQYPAETQEGEQLCNAADVSVHQPDDPLGVILSESRKDSDETLTDDLDNTLVDDTVAVTSNLSIRYSQVMLDSDDMNFLDMLKDMEEKSIIEEDSVMGTPTNDFDIASDDENEYSQVFNEETILMDNIPSKYEDIYDNTPNWNDSFWDGANIPQMDGTCDDEHIKKVRKRKRRSLKLGLSRPTCKSKGIKSEEEKSEIIIIDSDEINTTVTQNLNIVKIENESDLNIGSVFSDNSGRDKIEHMNENENMSITDLVNKNTSRYESETGSKLETSEIYDLQQNYEPVAGPSCYLNNMERESSGCKTIHQSLDCSTSPEENDLGIISFYNTSNIFNVTVENNQEINSSFENLHDNVKVKQEITTNISSEEEYYIQTNNDGNVNLSKSSVILTPQIRPPSKNYIISSLPRYNIAKVQNKKPYYSNYKDVGDKIEIGQMVIKLRSKVSDDQKPFDSKLNTTSIEEWRQLLFLQNNETIEDTTDAKTLKTLLAGNRQCILEPINRPPNAIEVKKWLESRELQTPQKENFIQSVTKAKNLDELDNSQAIGLDDDVINNSVSLESTEKDKSAINETLQVTLQTDGSYLCFGNGTCSNEEVDAPVVEDSFLTVMVLEVHTNVREDFNPDPTLDSIVAVFLAITNDCPSDHFLNRSITEIIVVDALSKPKAFDRCVFNTPIKYVNTEDELLQAVIDTVKRHDPDIMCGYDIEMNSWGYLIERSQVLGVEIIAEFSRVTEKNRQKRWRSNENDFEGRIIGRITFNVWRLFRYEMALTSYSFENCMYEVLKERVPTYSYSELSEWWNEESRAMRWIPIEYYLTKLSGTVRMLEKLDMINRTSELARLFGLQWWEVLSRGSQFRVESLMLRAARPLNLVALSPTVKQRAAMMAPECLPLILEPESRFYSDPVIVLDFQSLYPSMMIAYNYCFSTCIGRVQNINGEYSYEFGAWRLRIPKAKLEALVKSGLVHWSPVGVGFVKSSVRRGVLPALLRRILAARQAVKKSMKMQTDESLKKAMHSRQLGLKLIANVTYGYTAANYSGRMPCVEVADSVVSKGRETLERAIKLVEKSQWNAKVVYGDTDSMFVLVPGGTRAEAFQIGQEIADAVTADNPSPVALKFEKVYQPCILQTKKRYVGCMYENPDQVNPVYEAKGIETVRRDGCPAGVKVLQRSLCELFDSGDMSQVKCIVKSLLNKLVHGTLPVHELFFTREYNGPNGYKPGTAAPPAEIAKRLSSRDSRSPPRPGWRVSWLVCAGSPGQPLVRLARTPAELRREPALRPYVAYYATRVLLPPLHRCLSLLGVNVFKWWNEIGYIREVSLNLGGGVGGGIARYLWRERCALCGSRSPRSVCPQCAGRPQRAIAALAVRHNTATLHVLQCAELCASCCGHAHSLQCTNTECPVLWRRQSDRQRLNNINDIMRQLPDTLKCT